VRLAPALLLAFPLVAASACLAPSGSKDSGASTDPVNGDGAAEPAWGNYTQPVFGPKPLLVDGPEAWNVTGPGIRELNLHSNKTFSVTNVAYHNDAPSQPISEAYKTQGFWLWLHPKANGTQTANPTCEPAPDFRFWTSQVEAGNVFWPDLAAGDYVLLVGTGDGRVDVRFNDASSRRATEKVESQAAPYDATAYEPTMKESTNHAEFSETLKVTGPAVVLTLFDTNLWAGPGDARASTRIAAADDTACATAEKDKSPTATMTYGPLSAHAVATAPGEYTWTGSFTGNDLTPFSGAHAAGLVLTYQQRH